MTSKPDPLNMSCPVPRSDHDTVQLAHGGGGRMMRTLIEDLLLPCFRGRRGSADTTPPHDSAVVEIDGVRLAFTTDSFVVSPLFFPGGDIGKLAVCGTVNDLAMAGAKPLYLSCGLILEEGTSLEVLRRVVESMQRTAEEIGVQIVTGDTKVVDRGKADGIFINTSGVGLVPAGITVHPSRVRVGDQILISGDIGRHGIAIMSQREGLRFAGAPASDCASLADLVSHLTALGAGLHCLRDLTRGGLAAALIEIADHVSVGVVLHESAIPIESQVRGACELLGLDPLYVANEGRLVAIVAPDGAQQALRILAAHPAAPAAAIIGEVTAEHPGEVELHNAFGNGRLLDLLSGEQMPRIC
ncbi:MAG: hydrogenase expression/formation protein HypE [Pirellulaceae bacterium]